jgi:ABC-type amino acid transport substrate-binding protein
MLIRIALILLLLSLPAPCALAGATIYYPRPESATDKRYDYPARLLELVLKKSGDAYLPLPSPISMPQSRALAEVANGSKLVTVAWGMTSIERERQVLPIRIPVDKGLLGWRLALVSDKHPDLFKGVTSVRELGAFSAGMGHDWPDTPLFRANGQKVLDVPNYELLFRMLANGRFHYFPRSVNEVWEELDAHKGIVLDQHIALHYTAPFYFFVHKDNAALAAAITDGFERAIADGSFDRLFKEYFGKQIRRAGIGRRRVLELNNPSLPPQTPLGRKEFWLRLP